MVYECVYLSRGRFIRREWTTNGIIACWAHASPYKGLLRCKQMRNAYHVCTRHAFAFPLSTLQRHFDVASELLSVISFNYSQREKVGPVITSRMESRHEM